MTLGEGSNESRGLVRDSYNSESRDRRDRNSKKTSEINYKGNRNIAVLNANGAIFLYCFGHTEKRTFLGGG